MKAIRTIALSLLALVALPAGAAKAFPVIRQVTLDDGRTVTIKAYGDENLHYFLSTDNEVVLYDDSIGYHVATETEMQKMREVRDSLSNIEEETLTSLAKSFHIYNTVGKTMSATSGGNEIRTAANFAPTTGTVHIPVILVNFSDEQLSYTNDELDSIFNSTVVYDTAPAGHTYYSYGSVAAYFAFNSNGLYTPVFDIVGPVTLDMSCTSFSSSTSDSQRRTMVADAINAIDPYLDFSQYDSDGDGYVDDIFVLAAGYDQAYDNISNAGRLWSAASSSSISVDGVTTRRWAACAELRGNQSERDYYGLMPNFGTYCHEFLHTLGLADHYRNPDFDTEYMNDSGMLRWDVMDEGFYSSNSQKPIPLTAWERAYLGWTDPIERLDASTDLTLLPWSQGGTAYVVPVDSTADEYYVLENIPKDNGWYRSVPNSGMIVTHIDWSTSAYTSNRINYTAGHPRMYVIAADSCLLDSYYITETNWSSIYLASMKGDPFPGTSNVTELTEWHPYLTMDNRALTGIEQQSDGSVTLRYRASYLMGDANADGQVTVADANSVVDYYLGEPPTPFDSWAADINKDGDITVDDANGIVNSYLEEE